MNEKRYREILELEIAARQRYDNLYGNQHVSTTMISKPKRDSLKLELGKLQHDLEFWTKKARKIRAEIETAEPGTETKFTATWLQNIEVRIRHIQLDLKRVKALIEQ
jgi:hypothetical protein